MKRLWLVRLGRNGEFESDALERSLLSIRFGKISYLGHEDRDATLDVIR